MRIRRIVTVIGLLAVGLAPSAVRADGLLETLPKDGQWVRYDVAVRMSGDSQQILDGSVTLRSVGRTTVKGKPSRWIEFATDFGINDQQQGHTSILKMLIPEKQFGKGKNPLAHIVRGWIRDSSDDPRKLTDSDFGPGDLVRKLLAGPLKNVRNLKKKRGVKYQKGELNCSGHQGTIRIKNNTAIGFQTDMNVDYSVWTQSRVPFGAAAARIKLTALQNGIVLLKVTTNLELNDFGNSAKSGLPNSW